MVNKISAFEAKAKKCKVKDFILKAKAKAEATILQGQGHKLP